MPAEYSFFLASGVTVSAIEAAEAARRDYLAQYKDLDDHFGADGHFREIDEKTSHYRISCITFDPDANLPKGWDMTMPRKRNQVPFGLPKPGTADAFYVADMASLMERSFRDMLVENQLGVGEMPSKQLPAGEYSGAFVRERTLEDSDARPPGRLRDRSTICFGSTTDGTVDDPVEYMKLDGSWYIRVPNKIGSDEPQFVPPDSMRVPYDRMIQLDMAEYERRRYAPFVPSQPMSHKPGTGGPA